MVIIKYGGITWYDLGEIITPNTPFEMNQSFDIGGGAFVIAGEYFYVYFRDLIQGGIRNQLAVARAKVADVINAAYNQTNVVPWSKYYNGYWSQHGIAGRSSPLEITNPFSQFFSVSHNETLQKYILVIGNEANLRFAYSPDGINWSARQPIESEDGESSYPSLIGLGNEPRNSAQNFCVYYTYSIVGGWDKWNDAVLARRLITLTPITTAAYQASTDFFSIQGYNNWYYRGSDGNKMIFNETNNKWKGNEPYLLITKDGGHPGNNTNAVREWIAPRSGTITITGKAYDKDITCGQGVQVSIKQNATILWNNYINNGNTVGYTFNL